MTDAEVKGLLEALKTAQSYLGEEDSDPRYDLRYFEVLEIIDTALKNAGELS